MGVRAGRQELQRGGGCSVGGAARAHAPPRPHSRNAKQCSLGFLLTNELQAWKPKVIMLQVQTFPCKNVKDLIYFGA